MTKNVMPTVTDANNNKNASTSQETNVCVQNAVNKAPGKNLEMMEVSTRGYLTFKKNFIAFK
jgi:hypothetical protein